MEQNITNNQRIATLTELRSMAEKEMTFCTQRIESPMLIACNCIVATEDASYQIGIDENNKAKVLIGNYTNPMFFSEQYANKIAKEVKASNGYGPLKFIVWGWKSFYKARRDELQKHLDVYNELLKQFKN